MAVKKWLLIEKVDDIEANIKYVENFLKIKFPEDFIQCIRKNNGGGPIPNNFYFGDNEENVEVFNNLLTFDLDSELSIINTYNRQKKRLLERVFPFAADPFGNYLCFDYRNGDDPIVVFFIIDLEPVIKKVCNTFTELLDMLEEFEEEELGIFVENSQEDE